jgi:hypothetical protein
VAVIIEENTACKGEDKDVKGMSPLRNGGRMEKAKMSRACLRWEMEEKWRRQRFAEHVFAEKWGA